jgi:hypothetical protein
VVAGEQVAELRVLAVGEVLAALDDRHLRAETPVRLRELERHRSRPDADEMARALGRAHEVVAVHGGHRVRTVELVCGMEARREAHEVDPALVQQPLVVRDALVDDAPNAGHHGREIDLRAPHPDPELLCPVDDVVGDLGGPDQGFRGYAPTRDSGAADRSRLEERRAGAAPACIERRRDARHPAADDRDVDALAHAAQRRRQRS